MSPRSREVEETTTGAPPTRPRVISPLRVAAGDMRPRLPGPAPLSRRRPAGARYSSVTAVEDGVSDQLVKLPDIDSLAEFDLDVASTGPHLDLSIEIQRTSVL